MPQVRRESGMRDETVRSERRRGRHGRKSDGVEVSRTIAAKSHGAGAKILHRKAKRVKLNRTIIVASELANGN